MVQTGALLKNVHRTFALARWFTDSHRFAGQNTSALARGTCRTLNSCLHTATSRNLPVSAAPISPSHYRCSTYSAAYGGLFYKTASLPLKLVVNTHCAARRRANNVASPVPCRRDIKPRQRTQLRPPPAHADPLLTRGQKCICCTLHLPPPCAFCATAHIPSCLFGFCARCRTGGAPHATLHFCCTAYRHILL